MKRSLCSWVQDATDVDTPLLVAKVLSVAKHPKADKLSVCEVSLAG